MQIPGFFEKPGILMYIQTKRVTTLHHGDLIFRRGVGAIYAPKKRTKRAERVGFEPTVTTSATTVFETDPFGHSGTSPDAGIIPDNPLKLDDLLPLGVFHLVQSVAL